MSVSKDRQGLTVTGSAASAAALDRVLHDYYAWTGDILGELVAAVAADPGFALGHATIATILNLGGFRGDHPAVASAIAAAKAHAAGVTDRERAHLAIAEDLAAGEMRSAARRCETILLDHPRDALALRYATDLYYYLGDSAAIRDTVARVLPEWDPADPLFGFLLGRYAFGLEEAGELDRAYDVARRALAIHPEDAWATHATAHVFEMSARPADGVRFLEDTHQHWRAGKWIAVHNGWHLAVFLIEAGRGDEVLARYDTFVQPRLKENFILDLIDASSLLWRLELVGIDVGDRWREVATVAAARIGEHVLCFNDLHVACATIGAKDRAATRRLVESVDRFMASGRGDTHAIMGEVGRDLLLAMDAFGAGEWRRTIDLLLPLRHKVVAIGGSHAQRDLVNETLIGAAIKAEDWKLARALLAERAAKRPTARSWRLYGQALAHTGEAEALANARRLFGAAPKS